MRRTTLWTVPLTAAAVLSASPAVAGPRPVVDLTGPGTYAVDALGAALATGAVTGRPFDGTFVAHLSADDGSLPDPGSCEPAAAALQVSGSRDRLLELDATGTVCGEHLQPPYVVTHVFTGRYDVTASSTRRILGTDGFLEVRLATEGRANVLAIDT